MTYKNIIKTSIAITITWGAFFILLNISKASYAPDEDLDTTSKNLIDTRELQKDIIKLASTDNTPSLGKRDFTPTRADVICMAENIYHEARGQSNVGKIAVGLVVINRVHDRRWPATICEVVFQGPVRESWKTKQQKDLDISLREYYPIKHRCQFSWYCDGRSDYIDKTSYQWVLSLQIAEKLLNNNKYQGLLEGATHYHADSVSPNWRLGMVFITKIDNHLFYRQD